MGESDDSSGGNGGDDVYRGRAEPVLVSLSDLYSEDDSISVHNSRPSSCPTYTITDYCSNEMVNNFVLRRMFYSRLLF